MGGSLSGRYEGEGPNASGAQAQAVPADVSIVNPSGQQGPVGSVQDVAIDRRRRLRTSNESARDGTAINYGAGDQILAKATRWVYIAAASTNLVCRLVDSAADVTFTNIPAGIWPLSIVIVRATSTCAGVLLF